MKRERILVVEDDPAILAGLCEKLSMEGFEVALAEDGEAAREEIAREKPDLIILDLMLPRLAGLEVLRWLRGLDRELPVLILSAKGSESDKVEGLRIGADDYLAKPFGLRELLARIEALLRRHRGSGTLRVGLVEIDLDTRRVFSEGEEVALSKKELEVLMILARHRGRVLSREQILESVWGYFSEKNARSVDYHILNLRRKIERDPAKPAVILTRRGLGFVMAES